MPIGLKICQSFVSLKIILLGSSCGSVGRAVASDSRGLRFKYRHRQKIIENLLSTVLKRLK